MKQKIPFSEIFPISIEKTEEPLYKQVYKQIKNSILKGQLPAKTKLPASRNLAKRLGISRNTIVTAYDQLWAEGFIERKTGSGTYIAEIHFIETLLHSKIEQNSNKKPQLSKRGQKICDLAKKDYISQAMPFVPGIPDLQAFPNKLWGRMLSKKCRTQMGHILAYENPAGHDPLRKAICNYLKSCRGVKCTPHQVIITSGAQQGLDLITRFLIDPKDKIAIENPGYLGARNAFLAAEAQLVPIQVDQRGMNIDQLEKSKNIRLAYLTPSHQYPLGVTMPLARRLQLLQWAQKKNAWIIEDDYDSEYRYYGQPIASMQGIDASNRVIYLGTFSKVLFPGLRLGYIVVPQALVATFTLAKSIADQNSTTLLQSVLADFINRGFFTTHLHRMRILYKNKQEYFVKNFNDKLGKYFSLQPNPTGMHLVAFCKKKWSDKKISQYALQQNLHIRPLSAYYLKNPVNGLVLGYAGFGQDQTQKGLEILHKICISNFECKL